ncbi:adenosylcobinamide-phosphate synthase CbiB [Halomonas sp. McH1-25]|uniref:adenosylcobinamide-phosphate synthase CbiB n=1 Tax=unclassified Halomonas TaxID=2609666 RepID=UPI001EF53974|nr:MULTISPECIES: adenosylcobinamide-phosphate synthase CbiB [unclassified Halomonas]MCG7599885.1 adenosylcobinamide-phosphate synthase CbiB [Halomonas sp. McH1-25]MCP1344387.1 adenosylcobinamide-phosphate synthase CbiB [Halomonas sp. FL8]MCP1362879.1 adenosylcobinamide-phosphate synthase CbiB [Halomonas sp. BBD45]
MLVEPFSLAGSGLLLVAITLDLLVGDPRWLPHPVVIIGRLISRLDRAWNHGSSQARRIRGVLLTALVVLGTYTTAWLALAALTWLHPWLGMLGEIALLTTTLAIKGLRDAALEVARPLARGDLVTARSRLAMIVGRDTQALDEGEITRASVETVAENTVDGITAPLFWAFIGGAPLALAYKAVNTLDSMVGYLSSRHADFGYASAKLDDLANWIPARLTAVCLWLAAWLVPNARVRGALVATWRDAPRHPSPNAGWPEAMMAHLLGVQLGGTNHYQGRVSQRATLGTPREVLSVTHVFRAIRHMHAGWLAFVLLLAIVALLWEAIA